jgi:hypothetical protein
MRTRAGLLLICGTVVMALHELFPRYQLGGEIKPPFIAGSSQSWRVMTSPHPSCTCLTR